MRAWCARATLWFICVLRASERAREAKRHGFISIPRAAYANVSDAASPCMRAPRWASASVITRNGVHTNRCSARGKIWMIKRRRRAPIEMLKSGNLNSAWNMRERAAYITVTHTQPGGCVYALQVYNPYQKGSCRESDLFLIFRAGKSVPLAYLIWTKITL